MLTKYNKRTRLLNYIYIFIFFKARNLYLHYAVSQWKWRGVCGITAFRYIRNMKTPSGDKA